jgi:UDP-N-acetylglucosamine 3-dehydrogenase
MSDPDLKYPTNTATPRGAGRKVRLGIVGCGAIAESAHLPAVLSSPSVELTALSEVSDPRRSYIQRRFGLGPICFDDYHEVLPRVDAVVLALPNALHASVGTEFLSRGIHVLCEKPLATSSHECKQMCETAQAALAVLAVGFVTRFFPSTELTKLVIESGFLGAVQSFDYEFGTDGGWATLSGYNLSRSTSGGGVLVVSGSHFLDRMFYLFGDLDLVSYADDNHGGVEANCVARFEGSLRGHAVQGRITLSKTHRLANRLRIIGETGTLEIGEGQSRSVTYIPTQSGLQHEISMIETARAKSEPDYFSVQLEDFVRAIQTGTSPRIDGEQGSKSVAIGERCYELAAPLEEPWCTATLERLESSVLQAKAAAIDGSYALGSSRG